jgi:hypothetical protein
MPEPTLKRANAIRYCFDDPDLDFMFQWAAGAAKTGGLDPGERFYIASGMDGRPRLACGAVGAAQDISAAGRRDRRRRTVRSTTQPGSPKRYATG